MTTLCLLGWCLLTAQPGVCSVVTEKHPFESSDVPHAGMMDADEFLVIKDGSPSLPAVLQRYEAFGGLAVNWRLFGSSGHATR